VDEEWLREIRLDTNNLQAEMSQQAVGGIFSSLHELDDEYHDNPHCYHS
jgi:hypothetical protein